MENKLYDVDPYTIHGADCSRQEYRAMIVYSINYEAGVENYPEFQKEFDLSPEEEKKRFTERIIDYPEFVEKYGNNKNHNHGTPL